MSTAQLMRQGGLALALGGALWGAHEILWATLVRSGDPMIYPQPTAMLVWLVALLGGLFLLLGLPAVYAAQAGRAGRLGIVSFLVAFAGLAMVTGMALFGTFLQAPLAELIVQAEDAGLVVNKDPVSATIGAIAALALYVLGWLLFGVASLRARVFPRWPVVLAMIGSLIWPLAEAGLPVPLPVFAVGVVWWGLALWRRARTSDEPTVTAREAAPVHQTA